jgi:hypothetical protein
MANKIAGIDVHKKVLMVVVVDRATPDEKPERRRFPTMPTECATSRYGCRNMAWKRW